MMTNSYKWVDQWLSDEGHDPNMFNMYQKKMFADLATNGPQGYSDLENKFEISHTTVHDRLKQFMDIGWINKEAQPTNRGRPIIKFCSIYEVE